MIKLRNPVKPPLGLWRSFLQDCFAPGWEWLMAVPFGIVALASVVDRWTQFELSLPMPWVLCILALTLLAFTFRGYRAIWMQARRPVLHLRPLHEGRIDADNNYAYAGLCRVSVTAPTFAMPISGLRLEVEEFQWIYVDPARNPSASDPDVRTPFDLDRVGKHEVLSPGGETQFTVGMWHIDAGAIDFAPHGRRLMKDGYQYRFRLRLTSHETPPRLSWFELHTDGLNLVATPSEPFSREVLETRGPKDLFSRQ